MSNDVISLELQVVTVKVDGTVAEETWLGNDKRHLEHLQAMVDGYVERIFLGPDLLLWINEEGMFTLPPNPVLTRIVSTWGELKQLIHGNGVFTGPTDEDEIKSLTPTQVDDLLRLGEWASAATSMD